MIGTPILSVIPNYQFILLQFHQQMIKFSKAGINYSATAFRYHNPFSVYKIL